MIKILILTPYLTLHGGVNNYIKLLIKELSNNKIYQIKYLEVGKTESPLKDFFYPLLIYAQYLKLKRILKNYKPDIVHLNPSLAYTAIIRDLIFLKTINKKGFSTLLFIHGWQEAISNKFKIKYFKNFFKRNFDLADAIVVLASQFKNKILSLGIDDIKIHVSSTMVESTQYLQLNKNFSNPYYILFCANMKKEKGPFKLLEAIPLVIDKYPDINFIFIGDGKDLKKLKKKSWQLGLKNNVNFTGYISLEEKVNIFKKSHIFVFPSFHGEGFPTVILEAMAAGLPIITYPIAGLKDALEDKKEGLLLNNNRSKNEIAKKIIQLLKNQKLLKKISKNNIQEIKEKYDVKIVTEKIIQIYSEIL